MTQQAQFEKMNGLGNEIIVADMRGRADQITPQAAIYLAQAPLTRFDQIMAVYDPTDGKHDYRMEIWNQDGTEAQSCGNGTRCVVEWLYRTTGARHFTFDTKGGTVEAERLDNGLVAVDMGLPKCNWHDIPTSHPLDDTLHVSFDCGLLPDATLVSMGNPHAIFFVENDVWSYPLDEYGPKLEHDPLFPERCNISIAQIISEETINIRTWERGAGLTKACGTAACATTVAAILRNLTQRSVTANMPGGSLYIHWRDDGRVIMTGATEFEFSGYFDPLTGALTQSPEQNSKQGKA